MMKARFALVAALVLAALAGCSRESQAPYFEGKTVTIVVGYKPGGGYDATARLLARYLPKYLPGSPTVIVQNMPGANSLIAANYVYNAAKPDGLTIGTFNRNLPIGQLLSVDGVKFDMLKFAWIGSAASETTILAVRNDLPYRTVQDLKNAKQPLIVGATGPGANTYDFPLLLKEFAGLNLKLVSGYSSSSDIMLAIERKEADARAGSYSSIAPFIERKLVRPIVRARASEPSIENLPSDESLVPNPRSKAMMALRSAPEVIGRPYVMPPGTPPRVVSMMREAFAKVIEDSALVAEAKKADMNLNYVSGDKALETMKEVLNQPKDIVDEFRKYVKFGE
jgi:tripartite-type tricarboxylate transporter receptor subunit TctC